LATDIFLNIWCLAKIISNVKDTNFAYLAMP